MLDRLLNMKLTAILILFFLAFVMVAGPSLAQFIVEDPAGTVVMKPDTYFETGIWMKEGEVLRYSYEAEPKETRLSFNIHAHISGRVDTLVTAEGPSGNGSITAPYDGDFNPLWANLGRTEAKVRYNITLPIHKYNVSHTSGTYSFSITSNSEVSDALFIREDRTIKVNIKTPYAVGGVAYFDIPKDLLGGKFSVHVDDKAIGFNVDHTGASAILSLRVSEGFHEVRIAGSQGIPEFNVAFLSLGVLIGLAVILIVVKIGLNKKPKLSPLEKNTGFIKGIFGD